MRRILPVLIAAILLLPMWSNATSIKPAATYRYEARMAFLNAGVLTLDFDRKGEVYEFLGVFKTSRAMNKYYTWNGQFASKGQWQGGNPKTEAYLTLSKSSDDGYKVTLYGPKETRRMRKAIEPFETIPTPQGVDLISALFLSPDCYKGSKVHDGEDDYEIRLLNRKARAVKATERYYSGPGIQCEYEVRDNKDRKRRIQVALAEISGATVAVAASIKIPLLPDPSFRLLIADAGTLERAEKSSADVLGGL